MVLLEPLGVQRRHVRHFKGLIYAKVGLEVQGLDSSFTISYALVEKAILQLKSGFVQTHLHCIFLQIRTYDQNRNMVWRKKEEGIGVANRQPGPIAARGKGFLGNAGW